ncbi:hypothetical protein GOA98_24565 [Sinorhizobium meliloti]|nr:hypothetical protein [Sinorhizobium meliloti]
MTWTSFMLGVLALLLTPGPTNTMLLLASASKGVRASLTLIPAELLGYLTIVLPLGWLADRLLHSQPMLSIAVLSLAVLWLLIVTVRLKVQGCGTAVLIRPIDVFVTTLLNPKALVFGLLLLPSVNGASLDATAATFSILVIAASSFWIVVGDQTAKRAKLPMSFMARLSRVALSFFIIMLATSLVAEFRKMLV